MRNYRHYYKDGAPKICPHCHGTDFATDVRAIDGDWISEELYYCIDCRAEVAYWTYGEFDPRFYLFEDELESFYNLDFP